MNLPTKEKSSHPSSDSEKGTMTDKDNEPRLREINETGHIQELDRNFSLFSICSVGIVTGNTWAALGGSIVVAIYNGGPPGVLYEFIAVSIFYWLVAASIAVRYILPSLRTRSLQSLRSWHLLCLVVLESTIGLPSHLDLSTVALSAGLQAGGILSPGYAPVVSPNI
jgi:hypothetical protein